MVRAEPSTVASREPEGLSWPAIYRILRLDRGNPDAYEALARRIRPRAARDLRSHGGHLVEDAVVDTCSEAILDLAGARGAETFAGFVYGHYLNVRRRLLAHARRPLVPLDKEVEDRPAEPGGSAGPSPEQLAALRDALAHLSARERRALELRYLEGAAAERIAAELGVSAPNARRIVCNGLARLRGSVARALAAPVRSCA